MFDNLRQQSQQESGLEDVPVPAAESRPYTPASGNRLGLTPAQRFVLAWILFVLVTIMGCAVLLLSGKIVIPLTF